MHAYTGLFLVGGVALPLSLFSPLSLSRERALLLARSLARFLAFSQFLLSCILISLLSPDPHFSHHSPVFMMPKI